MTFVCTFEPARPKYGRTSLKEVDLAMMSFYFALIETDEQRGKFEYIYENYYGLMYHTAFSLTQDRQLAEDAVHETCLKIIDSIDTMRVDNKKELASYLCILTRSRTIDYLRRWCNKENSPAEVHIKPLSEVGAETVVLSSLQLEQVLQQLATMPEKYRTPLILRVKGYSIQEIAQFLKLSEGTVKTRIFRARQVLRYSFGD